MLTGLNSGELFYFIPRPKLLIFLHMVRKLKNRDLKTTLKSPYSGKKFKNPNFCLISAD